MRVHRGAGSLLPFQYFLAMVLVVAFSGGYDDRYQAANDSLGEHEPEGEMAKKVAFVSI